MCSVFIQETEKVVSISSEHLEPVTPTKNNKVTVALCLSLIPPVPLCTSFSACLSLYLSVSQPVGRLSIGSGPFELLSLIVERPS